MSLRDEIESVRRRHGYLTGQLVVDEWRPDNHPSHGRLTWDNTEAAERWRCHEATQLIRSVRIKFVDSADQPQEVRAYVSVRPQTGEPRRFEPTEDVMADPISASLLLAEMNREWKAFRARYGHMAEFSELIRASLDKAA